MSTNLPLYNVMADQLAALPNDGKRHELVQGDLHLILPAGGRHGRIALKMSQRIVNYVEDHTR